jgi:hypothetical protein
VVKAVLRHPLKLKWYVKEYYSAINPKIINIMPIRNKTPLVFANFISVLFRFLDKFLLLFV